MKNNQSTKTKAKQPGLQQHSREQLGHKNNPKNPKPPVDNLEPLDDQPQPGQQHSQEQRGCNNPKNPDCPTDR